MKKNLVLLFMLFAVVSMTFAQSNRQANTSGTVGTATTSPGHNDARFCPDVDLNITQPNAATGFGGISDDVDPAYTTATGFEDGFSADNFTVGATTTVLSVSVEGFLLDFLGTGATAYQAGDTYEITFYADAAGVPGAAVCTASFNANTVDPDFDGVFSASPSCTLPGAGTYWIGVTFVQQDGNSVLWAWFEGTGDGAGAFLDPTGFYGGTGAWDPTTTDRTFALDLCESDGSIVLVPTMTEWGLFLFGLGMVTIGLVFVYNKQRQLA